MRAGMRGGGYVRLYVGVGGILIGQGEGDSGYYPAWTLTAECADPLPDLTDPATLGALLGAVREAWGCPGAHTACGTDPSTGRIAWWFASVGGEDRLFRCDDEGTALLAAWAARPTVPCCLPEPQMTQPPTRLTRLFCTARAYVAFARWRLNMAVRENR